MHFVPPHPVTTKSASSTATTTIGQHLQIPSTELMNIFEAGIWVVSMDGKIVYVNPSVCKMFGYTADEMLNHSATEFLGAPNSTLYAEHIARRQQGLADSYAFLLPRRDGSMLDVMVAANAVFDKDKNVIGAMAVITENKGSAINAKLATQSNPYLFGNLELFPGSIEYAINGQRFEISHFAFKLLSYFVKNNGRVIARSEIIEHVWENAQTSDRVIDAHIVALRKKLKDFDGALKMVYGLGYILKTNEKSNGNV